MVVLPAPVAPTMPTRCPAGTSNETSRSTQLTSEPLPAAAAAAVAASTP